MKEEQAKRLIKETFENSFDEDRFNKFIRNLLNHLDENATFVYEGNDFPAVYKDYIDSLERIGQLNDNKNKIDVLIVKLEKISSVEHARTMQRNFIAWYLNEGQDGNLKDAALVAFVSPEDWRFSLIKIDYRLEDKKVKEEFTPARRWSFLVGKNEKSHTAQSQLIPLLINDDHDPTLKELEKAFDIEPVTKEFFVKYRELFIKLKDELDKVLMNDKDLQSHFKEKNIDSVAFAKKFLGQIMFLYFLQKKGWFGVPRDDKWGAGSKNFLRELFEEKYGKYKNFFNDILEPLFYEALSTKHDDNFYSHFGCKIPFLNGGLFDPINYYDWVHKDVLLPNEIFSNRNKTKEGDVGDGILDIFDRYNFTVKEDEPLEKEVAIDPEMLGKIYEKFNAIRSDNYDEYMKVLNSKEKDAETKFNKKYGVYYTPRDVVHYINQESLINYLDGALKDNKISKEDIKQLVKFGEQVWENEAIPLEKENLIKEETRKTARDKPFLPDKIRENAEIIDQKLADVTICDPAVGSGAFVVGAMSEIVKLRKILSSNEKETYELKRHCIEHSIYGVDIDPGAVEITKLRLWLSLIVDEEDINNINPLPNLDYKIMNGNSLVEILSQGVLEKGTINEIEKDRLIDKYDAKKEEYLKTTLRDEKEKLRKEIDEMIVEIFNKRKDKELERVREKIDHMQRRLIEDDKNLSKKIENQLEELNKEMEKLESSKLPNDPSRHFEWHINFSEVYKKNSGFDIVIANPPYIQLQKAVDDKQKLRCPQS